MVDDFNLLVDLHKGANRQGPGSDAETEKAIALAAIDRGAPLKIADIGCGTGASTLTLARLLNAQIMAVDFLQDFIAVLAVRAQREGVNRKVSPICASMEQLPFAYEEFDVIWSEGAIYNIGFETGIADWRRYLKPGGLLVASEITWLTNSRPRELQEHWSSEYPEIDTASAKIKALEDRGYTPIGYFPLPEQCWLNNYYEPMRKSFDDFVSRNGGGQGTHAIIEAEQHEIELYEKNNWNQLTSISRIFVSKSVLIQRKTATRKTMASGMSGSGNPRPEFLAAYRRTSSRSTVRS